VQGDWVWTHVSYGCGGVWKAVLDWINDHVQLRNSETPKLFYISTAQVLPLR